MTEERWGEIESLFNSLVELPPDQHHSHLRSHCLEDHDLMDVLTRLLAAHSRDAKRVQGVVDRAFAGAKRTARSVGK